MARGCDASSEQWWCSVRAKALAAAAREGRSGRHTRSRSLGAGVTQLRDYAIVCVHPAPSTTLRGDAHQ
jgi:hypothetical protein